MQASRQDSQVPTKVREEHPDPSCALRSILDFFVSFSFLPNLVYPGTPRSANGNIFTIKAKGGQPVSITSFDINMSGPPAPNPAPLEIGFLPGIDPGYRNARSYPYQLIFQGDVAGQGKGSVTTLPDFDAPVVIPAGATYSFYVTVADLRLGTNLWYNIGSAVGSVVASDGHVEVGEGYAVGYPFLGYSDERRWNGEARCRPERRARISHGERLVHTRSRFSRTHVGAPWLRVFIRQRPLHRRSRARDRIPDATAHEGADPEADDVEPDVSRFRRRFDGPDQSPDDTIPRRA